jgi:hypothetical protein
MSENTKNLFLCKKTPEKIHIFYLFVLFDKIFFINLRTNSLNEQIIIGVKYKFYGYWK